MANDICSLVILSNNFLDSGLKWNLELELNQENIDHWSGVKLNEEGSVISLDLSDLELTGEFPANVQLPALEELNLSGNQLTGVPAELGSNMPKLRILNLEGNQFKGLHSLKDSLRDLQSLTRLNLMDNPTLENCPGVEFVDAMSIQKFVNTSKALELKEKPITSFISKLFLLLAVPFAFANIATDIIQAVQFAHDGFLVLMVTQIALVLIPVIVNLSLLTDCKRETWMLRLLVVTQMYVVYETWMSLKTLTTSIQMQFLKVIETVLESYPSALLQLVVLVSTYYDPNSSAAAAVSLIVSIVVSIVSTSMTFATVRSSYFDEIVVSRCTIKILLLGERVQAPNCTHCSKPCTFKVALNLSFFCWECEKTYENLTWQRWQCNDCNWEYCPTCYLPEGLAYKERPPFYKRLEIEIPLLDILCLLHYSAEKSFRLITAALLFAVAQRYGVIAASISIVVRLAIIVFFSDTMLEVRTRGFAGTNGLAKGYTYFRDCLYKALILMATDTLADDGPKVKLASLVLTTVEGAAYMLLFMFLGGQAAVSVRSHGSLVAGVLYTACASWVAKMLTLVCIWRLSNPDTKFIDVFVVTKISPDGKGEEVQNLQGRDKEGDDDDDDDDDDDGDVEMPGEEGGDIEMRKLVEVTVG